MRIFSQGEKLHGKNFPSQRINEIYSLGTRVVAGLWSLLLMTARVWAQSSASSPFSPLWPAWVPQEFSPQSLGVMRTRTMPAKVPILTLFTGQAGADVAAHGVGAGAVPRALRPLCALIDICRGDAPWHQDKHLGWGPRGRGVSPCHLSSAAHPLSGQPGRGHSH